MFNTIFIMINIMIMIVIIIMIMVMIIIMIMIITTSSNKCQCYEMKYMLEISSNVSFIHVTHTRVIEKTTTIAFIQLFTIFSNALRDKKMILKG